MCLRKHALTRRPFIILEIAEGIRRRLFFSKNGRRAHVVGVEGGVLALRSKSPPAAGLHWLPNHVFTIP